MHTEQQGQTALFSLARIFLRRFRWIVPALALAWFSVSSVPVIAQSVDGKEVQNASQDAPSKKTQAPKQVELPAPPPSRFVPGFAEALIATGDVTDDENADLDAAVKAFHDAPAAAGPQGDYSDYAKPFIKFLETHPKSAWNAAILTNLGLGYFHAGYFSDAADAWKNAWELGKDAKTEQAHMLAGRAGGELAHFYGQIGWERETSAILGDLAKHPVGGPATELVQGAKDALWSFRNNPGMAFLCGPLSLKQLLITQKADQKALTMMDKARSGPHGFNLRQLSELADKAGFKHRLVHRNGGQPIPVPSVMHWGINHFAAITSVENGIYVVKDTAFGGGGDLVLTKKAIEKGSSGYFLIPASLTGDWKTIGARSPEAKSVYGMDNPLTSLADATMPSDTKISTCPGCNAPPAVIMGPCPTCNTPGTFTSPVNHPPQMAVADAHAMVNSLNIKDTPVGYEPQKGYSMLTTVTYNAREAMQPATFTSSNLSSKWSHSWQSYIVDDPTNLAIAPKRIAGGGGGYTYAASYGGGRYTYAETPDYSVLWRAPVSGAATSYTRYLPDGGFETYSLSDGAASYPRKMFLTSITDPAGNVTTINYDGTFRVTTVVDAMGRSTTFSYGLGTYPLLITQISDPFSRTTQITYDASQRLASITDPIGITSTFSYSAVEPTFIK
jgi:YD repeat-containing protein